MIDAQHFWSKVAVGAKNDCWLFTGSHRGLGYRAYQVDGKWRSAHAVALELSLGRPMRAGYEACHTCDNRPCCNPNHLWEGTRAENATDMARKNRGIKPGQRDATWRRNVGRATSERPQLTCDDCGRTIRGGRGNLRQHARGKQCTPKGDASDHR